MTYEAVESAENYLDTMAFSKESLIQQLTSSAGEKFTRSHLLLVWRFKTARSGRAVSSVVCAH